MTDTELQTIVSDVISALATNACSVTALTPVTDLNDDRWFEIDGGRRISFGTLKQLIRTALDDDFTTLQSLVDKKELKSVELVTSGNSTTLKISSVGNKVIECTIPIGAANGIAPLDASHKVPSTNLPMAEITAIAQQLFIDAWKAARGTYNATTGMYAMNGLTDITYDEARAILFDPGYLNLGAHVCAPRARTNVATSVNVPSVNNTIGSLRNLADVCYTNRVIEVAALGASTAKDSNGYPKGVVILTNNLDCAFYYCDKLTHIIGDIKIRDYQGTPLGMRRAFYKCEALEVVHLLNWAYDINWSWCSKLLVDDTIAYLIENKTNTTAITVDLHEDVYDQLTPTIIQQASTKNITFVQKEPYQ